MTSEVDAARAERRAEALWNKNAWLVGSKWNRLHFIDSVDFETWHTWWDNDSDPSYQRNELVTACGLTIHADLPGLFSRMGCPRCVNCCRVLGIPPGNGAALNDHSLDVHRSMTPDPASGRTP